ncbi:MAG: polyprenyl synthetase family protein [Ignavibacteriales bacterium]|nr:polyprenyl synthetase family protein [Ignavibacteriales bacterium]
MNFSIRYRRYRSYVHTYLKNFVRKDSPASLYEPSRYILSGGGKCVRPVLVLLACNVVGGRWKNALHAAAAMEILHNFTLVHDDIMDHADARRGRPTIHTRWDANVAILTGDVLIGLAYQALLRTPNAETNRLMRVFTQGIVEVCEGQAYDKEFETSRAVRPEDYLMMISKKTGRLIAVSAELGAIIGGGSRRQQTVLRQFGSAVGRAFQLQDDLLDIVGDEKSFGKKIGGDVVEGKKTFLLLHALRRAHGKDRALLMRVFHHHRVSWRSVEAVRRIYYATGAIDAARRLVERNTVAAHRALKSFPNSPARGMLAWFTDQLLHRTT